MVETFLIDGEIATIRYLRFSDWPDMLSYMNSLNNEKKGFVFSRHKMDGKRARKWVRGMLAEVEKKKGISLVVEIRGHVIGGSGVWKLRRNPSIGEFGIGLRHRMPHTRESLWGKGIGGKLLYAILREAKKVLKIRAVNLSAFVANYRAVALYRRCGFKERYRLRREKLCHGVLRDRIYMRKRLR